MIVLKKMEWPLKCGYFYLHFEINVATKNATGFEYLDIEKLPLSDTGEVTMK